jgi:hypothetical protein
VADPTVPAQLALFSRRLLTSCIRAVEDLTPEQLHHLPTPVANSIAFDIWHVVRTADNVVFFVFEREQPVWLAQGFQERWDLPKVAQGTGMPTEEAQALRFPDPAEFNRYTQAVLDAIVPRIEAMSVDYLSQITTVRPWGDVPRMEALNQTVLAHGNGHLGRVSLARTLLGKDDLGI